MIIATKKWMGVFCALALMAGAASAALIPCTSGTAGGYACNGVDLLAQVPLTSLGGGNGNDSWGWTDPVTGKEWALVGRTNGTAFVDISNPENPVYVANLPTHTVSSSWRDIKVYQGHAFIVADSAGAHGIQILDLGQLRNITTPPVTLAETAHYSGFGPAHNIAINEATGFAFAVDTDTCSGGLHMVNIQNPVAPFFVGCHGADGTLHDVQCVTYAGPDTAHQGKEICFGANLTLDALTIVDVTNKGATVTLSNTTYLGARVPHQSWVTEDHRYSLLGDEGDETALGHNTRTYILDIADLEGPFVLGTHTATTAAIDHNLYVKGNHVYQANYRAGLRILSLDPVAQGDLTEVAFFDTYPADDAAGFQGAWNTFPYFSSCVITVNDIQRGLFVLRAPGLCNCGNGVLDLGEECDGAILGGATCGDVGCNLGTPSCSTSCKLDFTTCGDCVQCDFDGLCETGEDCNGCPSDCVSGSVGVSCGNGICEAADGENCLNCAADCNGKQSGAAKNRFCCGNGGGQNPVSCTDARCTSNGFACTNLPGTPSNYCCGNLVCEAGEDATSCSLDCGGSPPPPPPTGCTLGQPGDACTAGSQCCSGNCKGKPGSQTCK